MRRGRFAVSTVAVHPGIAGTNLLARQLERAGRRRLAALSTGVTRVVLPSAAAGARSTLAALDPGTPSGQFIAPGGFRQLRGQPEAMTAYPSCTDRATARRVWELTEQALGRQLPT